MGQRFLNEAVFKDYENSLINEEKSKVTVEKYLRDIRHFFRYADCREMSKELVIDYKRKLIEDGYAVRSVNSMLASLNSLFRFMGWTDLSVRSLKTQRKIYCPESRELTKSEYLRLLDASKGKERIHLILQTIGSTGIRISELKYFTVESVRTG